MVEYTKKQKKYLAGIHETTRNNKNLAVKLFEQKFNRLITPRLVSMVWKEAGLKNNIPDYQRNGMNEQEFRDLYGKSKGFLEVMVEKSGYTEAGIRRLCNVHSLPYKRMSKPKRGRGNLYPISDT